MPYLYTRGSSLSESKIQRIIRSMRPSEIDHVIEMYWEYVPSTATTPNQKLAYIICAIPNAGAFPADLIRTQLIIGPTVFNDRDFEFAKPNVYAWLKLNHSDLIPRIVAFLKPHKHIPEKYQNDELYVLIFLAQVYDTFDFTTLNGLYKKCLKYLEKFDVGIEVGDVS